MFLFKVSLTLVRGMLRLIEYRYWCTDVLFVEPTLTYVNIDVSFIDEQTTS